MSAAQLYGNWDVVTVVMINDGDMRFSSSVRGSIRLGQNGAASEQVVASFDGDPFAWALTGDFYTDGNQLITRVATHNLTGLVGESIRRRFEFQPGTNYSRMMLYLPLGGMSITFNMRRT